MNKNLYKKGLMLIPILFLLAVICWSFYHGFVWFKDNQKISTQLQEIEEKVNIVPIIDNEKTEIIQEEDAPEEELYWHYVHTNLIDVNLDDLKEQNIDTVGWIQVKGTAANYPFVQSEDNEYYLNHSFDHTINQGGWVFLDYRNTIFPFDKNTIIYAHNRANDTMFGSLKRILNKEWLDNKENYIIKISTEHESTLWQIFSVYHIPTTNDYLRTKFYDEQDFLDFSHMLLERSFYDFKTTINEMDKILTLSTCYNKKEKLVVHAKMIKREVKSP